MLEVAVAILIVICIVLLARQSRSASGFEDPSEYDRDSAYPHDDNKKIVISNRNNVLEWVGEGRNRPYVFGMDEATYGLPNLRCTQACAMGGEPGIISVDNNCYSNCERRMDTLFTSVNPYD
jgi:hypothetical protein